MIDRDYVGVEHSNVPSLTEIHRLVDIAFRAGTRIKTSSLDEQTFVPPFDVDTETRASSAFDLPCIPPNSSTASPGSVGGSTLPPDKEPYGIRPEKGSSPPVDVLPKGVAVVQLNVHL